MTFRILNAAEAEADRAAAWYESRQAGLGRAFIVALRKSLADIQSRPHTLASLEGYLGRRNVRRDRLAGFPYVVIFQAIADDIVVVAIAHTSRRPNYWKSRLK